MTLLRRALQGVAAALAVTVYVWFAAVRNAARVKRRKALRRRARTRP